MLRTLLALAGLLLLAPATASADPFGELPFRPVRGSTSCLQATGSPGELVSQTETSVELLTASPAGLTSGVTLATDGALDCVNVGAWPGGGGLLAFPVTYGLDGEVWVRGFLREPGQGWGEATEILPPKEHLMSGAIESAVSERGDALVSMSVIDAEDRADVSVARRLPGGAFGAPERVTFGRTSSENAPDVHAGYSASGEAVITWTTKGAEEADPVELWTATAPPGEPFGAPQKLAAIDARSPYALTVGADGRALAVFPSDGRLVAAERPPGGVFGPPSLLAKTVDRLGSTPVAVLRPGGGAVVAWTSALTAGLTARTREQPGPFGPAIELVRRKELGEVATMVQQRFGGGNDSSQPGSRLQAALAPDGRVLLTWRHLAVRQGLWWIVPATATLDFAGRARETATYGGPLRMPDAVTPVLLADGSRAVAWTDSRGNSSDGRIHLAREGTPDRADPPAPAVKVTTIGSGALKAESPLRLRVTCDAACDVFVQLAGQEEVTDSTSLAAAGSRTLKLFPVSRPIAPRRSGKVRLFVRSGAPGAHRATARTVALDVRRAVIAFPPRPLAITVTPDGDDLVVRWRTAKPAPPERYSVWAVDDQGEPVASNEFRHGARRTSFEVRLKDAVGSERVIIYRLARNTVETRQTTVEVRR